MSKKTNNRFVIANKNIDKAQLNGHRKCAHHIYSYNYAANMRMYDEITKQHANFISQTDMDLTISIKVVFHFLAPRGSYNKDRVLSRALDIIAALNDDFNNYTSNHNTMNNFRYKSIINQVFIGNMPKQNIYLGPQYLQLLPTKPANIIFELGEIYYYPVKCRLNLSQYDDIMEVEMEHQAIKQFIHQNRASAINPDTILNIWIIDVTDTQILGFSNFPWENFDSYHGIVLHRRVFFPEDYGESNFAHFRTLTHEIGHYFGLLHVYGPNTGACNFGSVNINADNNFDLLANDDFLSQHAQLLPVYDPTDRINNKRLHNDLEYNPLFMNFMDYTHDKYVGMFTHNQIQRMRYMINKYRPKLNCLTNRILLPAPRYNPDTDTITGVVTKNLSNRTSTIIPSTEPVINPRNYAIPTTTIVTPIQIPNPSYVPMAPITPLDLPAQLPPQIYQPMAINPYSYATDPNAYSHYQQYYQQIAQEEMAKNNLAVAATNFDPRFVRPADPRFDPNIMRSYHQKIGYPPIGPNIPPPQPNIVAHNIPNIVPPPHPNIVAHNIPNMLPHAARIPQMRRVDPQFLNNIVEVTDSDDEPLTSPEVPLTRHVTQNNALKPDRCYTKYAHAKPETKKNSLDPRAKPPQNNLNLSVKNLRRQKENVLVPVNMDDAILADKIDIVNDQIKNIKSQLINNNIMVANTPSQNLVENIMPDIMPQQIIEPQSSVQFVAHADIPTKFNKFGQRMNAPTKRVRTKTNTTNIPKKKFVRSKPIGIN